jgi:Heparinase II/III-like protein/Heparinase II/III N-terminus
MEPDGRRHLRPLLRLRQFGAGALARRLVYLLRRKTGLLKHRCPTHSWQDVPLATLVAAGVPTDPVGYERYRAGSAPPAILPWGQPPSAESLADVMGDEGRRRLLGEADALLAGRFRFFRHREVDLGSPPDWLRNPENGFVFNAARHWIDVPDFAPQQGDIKMVWEASRFASAWVLARAWAATGDGRYAEAFWQLFESWYAANPPNRGPNWKCGQEASLRLMAWTFAVYVLANAEATTGERLVRMLRAVAVHAERIESNIGYALSQNNNHGISEAMGLLTAGLAFPELRRSDAWAAKGRRLIERLVRRQVYADGSYVQHSFNYHRLMLHDCLWAAVLAERSGRPLAADVLDRLRRSYRFLHQMSDASGCLPNYGANDGALVMVLDACDYRDYRPVIQLAARVLDGVRLLDDGPHDEPLLWFFGDAALDMPTEDAPRSSVRAAEGGYTTIRREDSWAIIRAHAFGDRPSHADALHVDLWWRGRNLLRDSGTYHYYAEPRFEAFFEATRAHNTVEVDGLSQMDKASRFLWDRWLKARTIRDERTAAGVHVWEGEHDGYHRLADPVTHRRSVIAVLGGLWLFIDDLLGAAEHTVRQFWQIGDCRATLDAAGRRLTLAAGDDTAELTIHGADDTSEIFYTEGLENDDEILGWRSLYYHEKEAAGVLMVRLRRKLPLRLVTVLRLGAAASQADVRLGEGRIDVMAGDQRCRIVLSALGKPGDGAGPLARVVGE